MVICLGLSKEYWIVSTFKHGIAHGQLSLTVDMFFVLLSKMAIQHIKKARNYYPEYHLNSGLPVSKRDWLEHKTKCTLLTFLQQDFHGRKKYNSEREFSRRLCCSQITRRIQLIYRSCMHKINEIQRQLINATHYH